MKRFKGFTLSELMIALTVLGILCATVLPAIINNSPNQNKMMMKKAYYTFAEVISELINDVANYPASDGLCPDTKTDGYIGFDCAPTSGHSKLAYLFSRQLNLADGKIEDEATLKTDATYSRSSLSECYGASISCYVFETNDGISWAFPKSTFTKGNATKTISIGIDVNGDKKPNCYQGSSSGNCRDRDNNFDQFRLDLYADGKVEINEDDEWAAEAIQVSSSLTD